MKSFKLKDLTKFNPMGITLDVPKKGKPKPGDKTPVTFATSAGFYIPKLEADDPENPPLRKNGEPKGLFKKGANGELIARPKVGEKCIFYFITPPCVGFGFSYKFPFGLPAEKQLPSEATGIQICYQCTPEDRVKTPTDEEQSAIDLFDSTYDRVWDIALEFSKKHGKDLTKWDKAVAEGFIAATRQGEHGTETIKSYALKPILSRKKYPIDPKTGMSAGENPDMPLRGYFNCYTKGKGTDMTVETHVYENDREIDPRESYMNTLCSYRLLLKYDGTFWGGHGSSSFRGSIKYKVAEVQITPMPRQSVPRVRMIRSKVPALAIEPQKEPEKILIKPKVEAKVEEKKEEKDASFVNPVVGDDSSIAEILGDTPAPIVIAPKKGKSKVVVKKQTPKT